MTHNPIRWTRVLYGVGLTLAVAVSPMLYLVLFAPVPDGHARRAGQGNAGLGLVSEGFGPAAHRSLFLLIAAVAMVTLLAAIAAAARSNLSESQHSRP